MEYLIEALRILIPLILGAWIGSKFNIINDKRKEYNEVVELVFLHLNKTKDFVENKNYNGISVPDEEMMHKLKLRLPSKQFKIFEKAIQKISLVKEELWQYSNEYGTYDYKKIPKNMHDEIVNSIENAISLMKIK